MAAGGEALIGDGHDRDATRVCFLLYRALQILELYKGINGGYEGQDKLMSWARVEDI
jgi:hypothetical protein